MIYLDSNATTQTDPAVLESMLPFFRDCWENPSSPTQGGRRARRSMEEAREHVAALLSADAEEIHFNSGATEGCNAVIESVRKLRPDRPRLVVSATEHPAVMEPAKRWQAQGGLLTIVPVHSNGIPDCEALKAILAKKDTALTSIMLANNETGVVAPISEIAQEVHESGAWMHTDAAQAVGKISVDVRNLDVDFLTLSGHKFHGPKGIGALYLRRHLPFVPFIVGGGQEMGRRSGTENVAGVVGLGKAAELAKLHKPLAISKLRDYFEAQILNLIPGAKVHGSEVHRLGNTCSLCIPEADAAGMLILLDQAGIACSAGSACHSASLHPSSVLEAMGVSVEDARRTLRFSFSRFNTSAQVSTAIDQVCRQAAKLKALALSDNGPVLVSGD